MTDEEILRKALEKAHSVDKELLGKLIEISEMNVHPYILFNHSFAEAFWGENKDKDYKYTSQSMYNFGEEFETEDFQGAHWIETPWKYHLMKMALEENPIDYIKQFI